MNLKLPGFFRFLALTSFLSNAVASEKWNFTPEDYAHLLQSGGSLTFSSESQWLPRTYLENVQETLVHALKKSEGPSVTDGVNVTDFFHGHVLCEGRNRYQKVFETPVESQIDEVFSRHHEKSFVFLSELLFPLFRNAMNEVQSILGKTLEWTLNPENCERSGVLYHSYEVVAPADAPQMPPNDPRRNFWKQNGKVSVDHFQADESHPWKSPGGDSVYIAQIAFLIDQKGTIHVTYGSLRELSLIVGKVLD
jgi:hypothetical protein